MGPSPRMIKCTLKALAFQRCLNVFCKMFAAAWKWKPPENIEGIHSSRPLVCSFHINSVRYYTNQASTEEGDYIQHYGTVGMALAICRDKIKVGFFWAWGKVKLIFLAFSILMWTFHNYTDRCLDHGSTNVGRQTFDSYATPDWLSSLLQMSMWELRGELNLGGEETVKM